MSGKEEVGKKKERKERKKELIRTREVIIHYCCLAELSPSTFFKPASKSIPWKVMLAVFQSLKASSEGGEAESHLRSTGAPIESDPI